MLDVETERIIGLTFTIPFHKEEMLEKLGTSFLFFFSFLFFHFLSFSFLLFSFLRVKFRLKVTENVLLGKHIKV